jgi:hypothetical protein
MHVVRRCVPVVLAWFSCSLAVHLPPKFSLLVIQRSSQSLET